MEANFLFYMQFSFENNPNHCNRRGETLGVILFCWHLKFSQKSPRTFFMHPWPSIVQCVLSSEFQKMKKLLCSLARQCGLFLLPLVFSYCSVSGFVVLKLGCRQEPFYYCTSCYQLCKAACSDMKLFQLPRLSGKSLYFIT